MRGKDFQGRERINGNEKEIEKKGNGNQVALYTWIKLSNDSN